MEGDGVVEYRVLGRAEIAVDGVTYGVSGRRQRLLLAALVLSAGREVPSDQLCELLWDDEQPRHPAAALRSQVARLRRTAGTDRVDVRFGASGYRLVTSPGATDVGRFEALARASGDLEGQAALAAASEALALWASTILEFADRLLLESPAVALVDRRASLVERRAGLLLELGRASDVIPELGALLAEHPEREGARALLMEGLYRSGRTTDALVLYRSWRDLLRDERGLEPNPRLRDLEIRILRHDIATRTPNRSDEPVRPTAARAVHAPSTSFVGRQLDMDELAERIRDDRLVTLTGPGGVGKTRLAVEVVSILADDLGEVIHVDLSVVTDRGDVARAIAAAVTARDVARRTVAEQIAERVGARRCILLLDNCEHVLDAVAPLVADLLPRSPRLRVIATSQERLGVPGEQVWEVSPLETMGEEAPAIRLFLDRAAAASRHRPAPGDLERIRRICTRLDGLPLGVEIAAAQTGAISLDDLERELEHRLELRALEAPPESRHRSLRSVVEWSHRRLTDLEQRSLERLSVFVDGFDLAAARALLRDVVGDQQVAPYLVQLVARSLLSFETRGGHGRYRMLQTVRAYGLERLGGRGELVTAQRCHAEWAIEVAAAADRAMAEHELASVQALDEHFGDLRAAHHWLVAHDVDGAMRLIGALHPFAFMHGRTEVFRWAEVVAALDGPSPLRPNVIASVCAGAWLRGDLDAAQRAAHAAIATSDLTSPSARRAVEQLGELALLEGDAARAVEMFDRAHQFSLQAGDVRQATWDLGSSALALLYTGHADSARERATDTAATANRVASPSVRAFAHFVLGELAADEDPALARELLERAVDLASSVGNDFLAGLAQVTLGTLASQERDSLPDTISHYRAAVTSWNERGAWTPLWVTLRNVVPLLTSSGAVHQAAVLYGAVLAASLTAGPLYGADRARLEAVACQLRDRLGDQRFTTLTDQGRLLPPHDVVQHTLAALDDITTD